MQTETVRKLMALENAPAGRARDFDRNERKIKKLLASASNGERVAYWGWRFSRAITLNEAELCERMIAVNS